MEIRNDHNWKEDIPAFREKRQPFMQENSVKMPTRAFPDCTEATRRRAERQACCVCA